MKNLKRKLLILLLTAAFVLSAVSGYFYFRNRDERMLRAMVAELESIAAKRPGKSNALALLDAATPERVFAPKLTVSSDIPKLERSFTTKELSQFLVSMKKSCSELSLDINIDDISINDEKSSAVISGNALFSGSSSRSSFREAREVELHCRKLDGEWKISAIQLIAIIKR